MRAAPQAQAALPLASKLHLGCGQVHLAGWLNVDNESEVAELLVDVNDGLPFPNASFAFVYSEHFIEHFTAEQGVSLLMETRRVLQPGGVMRIATPDLRFIAWRYFFRWRAQEWITRYEYEWMQTGAEMVNVAFREWGHQYLYDKPELERRLREAGFSRVWRAKRNRSAYPALRNLETRKDSALILETIR